jgi:pyruvate/2-oxoacid:ferredoxin oxidoreductase beta subunit/Pyruvate/2-oxoacid:ferredoxin oxidoreductase gamma subunit
VSADSKTSVAAAEPASAQTSYLLEETLPYPFCPGCGHTKIAGFIDMALQRLGRPAQKVVVVTDIGCVGLTDKHFGTNAFHGLHGRSITYASGIKLADPDLTVIVVMGDGATGIGGAHLLSAARRNIGISVVVANNFNYGMTGGQHSVTTPPGAVTSTTLRGNLEAPLDIPGTLMPSKPAFLARTSVFADDCVDLLTRAFRADGFSLVDMWDLCVAYYAGANTFNRESVEGLMEQLEMPAGVVYEGSRPEFARAWRDLYIDEVADEEGMCYLPPTKGLEPVAASGLEKRTSILISGSAGQKIRSAATLLGAGAIMCRLHATQKDDYPITVRTGHSAAEVILSPEPVVYTGVETPDVVLIISDDGLKHVKAKLASWPETTRVYIDQAVLPEQGLQTGARVIALPLAEAAKKVHRLAIGAVGLGAIIAQEELYPVEAFTAAAKKLQKAKVADTNIAGLLAGVELVAAGG